MLKWLKSLFGIKSREAYDPYWEHIKEAQEFVKNAQNKPKRPRLYKQATVVTSGELPKGEDYAWPFPTTIVPPPKPKRKPALKKATTRKEKTMPLKKSTSKAAFKENVAKEIKEGKKPVKQAVAIAYAVKREAAKSKAKKK